MDLWVELVFCSFNCYGVTINRELLLRELEQVVQMADNSMQSPLVNLAQAVADKVAAGTDCEWFGGGLRNVRGRQSAV